ncbi:MAG: hypothetical protein OQK32_05260 [Gammaproteobacteria bacterium]|nr:hypothetical protein [Gammaproteobacteria bacterium]MCW8924419.1 hypothetical protein [Gammaproteobacteria bacterium]
MGRFITLVIFIIAITSAFTMYRMQDVGFVSAGLGDYEYETTLLIAGGALLLGIFALMLLVKLYFLLQKISIFFGARRRARLLEKSRIALSHGLIELAEGRFEQAEKLLLKLIKHSDNALLAYLSAARAAQKQGEHERRDEYLRKAHETTPTAEIAIGLTKAELQLDHEQYEQALANLSHLHELSPNHFYIVKLLIKTYHHLADWKNLQSLLAEAKKHGIFPDDKILNLELETWCGLLNDQAHGTDISSLESIWQQVPATLKKYSKLVEHYAILLINANASIQAEQVLRNHLESHWSDTTIVLYSELDIAIENHQFEQVEGWLKEHPHNAALLLALGKLSFNMKLWGKAQNYLEASLSIEAQPETYLKLAHLLEQHMDQPEQAQTYYQKGLECLAGKQHEEITDTTATHNNEAPALTVVQTDRV